MDSRADFQLLLANLDKLIKARQQELAELDERLETSRKQLSEQEAKELSKLDNETNSTNLNNFNSNKQELDFDQYVEQERRVYEQQLEKFNEEFTNLEAFKEELASENDYLRLTLIQSEDELKKEGKKSKLLADSLDEVQKANFELNLRLAKAESEVQMQQKLLEKLHKEDELLMGAFDDKLELLKRAIEWRDAEIERLTSENQLSLDSLGVDSTKTVEFIVADKKERVIKVAETLREKEKQIELLSKQLEQATGELERNASLLELLEIKKNEPDVNSELEERIRNLEVELEAKDSQLHLVEFKNHQLEVVVPNKVNDLLQKLIDWFYKKDPKTQQPETIELLVSNLNELLGKINSTQGLLYKIDQLRLECESKNVQIQQLVSQLNVKLNDDELDMNFDSLNKISVEQRQQVSRETSKEIVRKPAKLERRNTFIVSSTPKKPDNKDEHLTKLEESKSNSNLDLQEEESNAKSKQIDKSIQMGNFRENLSSIDLNQNSKTSDQLKPSKKTSRNNEQTSNENSSNFEQGSSNLSNSDVKENENESYYGSEVKIESVTGSQRPNQVLEDRLKQIEAEKELLELAMKEILVSIKWSDAQCCSILIDCPSLEKLCQLIEARYITSCSSTNKSEIDKSTVTPDELQSNERLLFQFVVLKSELDLLRGQNEQLRAELKLQRRDYNEYLSNQREELNQKQSQLTFEVECQTEEDLEESLTLQNLETTEEGKRKSENKMLSIERIEETKTKACANCDRLQQLINHLLEAIERVEKRVEANEDNYMARLIRLLKLVEELEGDLSARDKALVSWRRESSLLNERRLALEAKLKLYESKMSKDSQGTCRSVILFNNNKLTQFGSESELVFDSSSGSSTSGEDGDINSFACDQMVLPCNQLNQRACAIDNQQGT